MSTLGKRLGPHPVEHVVRDAKLFAGVDSSVLAPQPLAVQQVSTSELDDDPSALQPLDRFGVESLGCLAFFEQRSGASQDPEGPIGACCERALLELSQSASAAISGAGLRAAASTTSTSAKPRTARSSNSKESSAWASASSYRPSPL